MPCCMSWSADALPVFWVSAKVRAEGSEDRNKPVNDGEIVARRVMSTVRPILWSCIAVNRVDVEKASVD